MINLTSHSQYKKNITPIILLVMLFPSSVLAENEWIELDGDGPPPIENTIPKKEHTKIVKKKSNNGSSSYKSVNDDFNSDEWEEITDIPRNNKKTSKTNEFVEITPDKPKEPKKSINKRVQSFSILPLETDNDLDDDESNHISLEEIVMAHQQTAEELQFEKNALNAPNIKLVEYPIQKVDTKQQILHKSSNNTWEKANLTKFKTFAYFMLNVFCIIAGLKLAWMLIQHVLKQKTKKQKEPEYNYDNLISKRKV